MNDEVKKAIQETSDIMQGTTERLDAIDGNLSQILSALGETVEKGVKVERAAKTAAKGAKKVKSSFQEILRGYGGLSDSLKSTSKEVDKELGKALQQFQDVFSKKITITPELDVQVGKTARNKVNVEKEIQAINNIIAEVIDRRTKAEKQMQELEKSGVKKYDITSLTSIGIESIDIEDVNKKYQNIENLTQEEIKNIKKLVKLRQEVEKTIPESAAISLISDADEVTLRKQMILIDNLTKMISKIQADENALMQQHHEVLFTPLVGSNDDLQKIISNLEEMSNKAAESIGRLYLPFVNLSDDIVTSIQKISKEGESAAISLENYTKQALKAVSIGSRFTQGFNPRNGLAETYLSDDSRTQKQDLREQLLKLTSSKSDNVRGQVIGYISNLARLENKSIEEYLTAYQKEYDEKSRKLIKELLKDPKWQNLSNNVLHSIGSDESIGLVRNSTPYIYDEPFDGHEKLVSLLNEELETREKILELVQEYNSLTQDEKNVVNGKFKGNQNLESVKDLLERTQGDNQKINAMLNQMVAVGSISTTASAMSPQSIEQTASEVSHLNEEINKSEDVFGAKKASNLEELYDEYRKMRVYEKNITMYPNSQQAEEAKKFKEEIVALNPQLKRLEGVTKRLTKRKFSDMFGDSFGVDTSFSQQAQTPVIEAKPIEEATQEEEKLNDTLSQTLRLKELVNREQINVDEFKEILYALPPEKISQINRMLDITRDLTSDVGIQVSVLTSKVGKYFELTGTRSRAGFFLNNEGEFTRKPNKNKVDFTSTSYVKGLNNSNPFYDFDKNTQRIPDLEKEVNYFREIEDIVENLDQNYIQNKQLSPIAAFGFNSVEEGEKALSICDEMILKMKEYYSLAENNGYKQNDLSYMSNLIQYVENQLRTAISTQVDNTKFTLQQRMVDEAYGYNIDNSQSNAPKELIDYYDQLFGQMRQGSLTAQDAIDLLDKKVKELGITFDLTSKKWINIQTPMALPQQVEHQTFENNIQEEEHLVQLTDEFGAKISANNSKLLEGTKLIEEKTQGIIKLYHNSNKIFEKFTLEQSGKNQGNSLGNGVYLATNNSDYNDVEYGKFQTEYYANIKNPLIKNPIYRMGEQAFDDFEFNGFSDEIIDKLINEFYADMSDAMKSSVKRKLATSGTFFQGLQQLGEPKGLASNDILKYLGYDSVISETEICIFNPDDIVRANDIIKALDGTVLSLEEATQQSKELEDITEQIKNKYDSINNHHLDESSTKEQFQQHISMLEELLPLMEQYSKMLDGRDNFHYFDDNGKYQNVWTTKIKESIENYQQVMNNKFSTLPQTEQSQSEQQVEEVQKRRLKIANQEYLEKHKLIQAAEEQVQAEEKVTEALTEQQRAEEAMKKMRESGSNKPWLDYLKEKELRQQQSQQSLLDDVMFGNVSDTNLFLPENAQETVQIMQQESQVEDEIINKKKDENKLSQESLTIAQNLMNLVGATQASTRDVIAQMFDEAAMKKVEVNVKDIMKQLSLDTGAQKIGIDQSVPSLQEIRDYINKSKIYFDSELASMTDWHQIRNGIGASSLIADQNQGTDIITFLGEMNSALGTTFDLTQNNADAFQSLFNEIQSRKTNISDNLLGNWSTQGIEQSIKEVVTFGDTVANIESKTKASTEANNKESQSFENIESSSKKAAKGKNDFNTANQKVRKGANESTQPLLSEKEALDKVGDSAENTKKNLIGMAQDSEKIFKSIMPKGGKFGEAAEQEFHDLADELAKTMPSGIYNSSWKMNDDGSMSGVIDYVNEQTKESIKLTYQWKEAVDDTEESYLALTSVSGKNNGIAYQKAQEQLNRNRTKANAKANRQMSAIPSKFHNTSEYNDLSIAMGNILSNKDLDSAVKAFETALDKMNQKINEFKGKVKNTASLDTVQSSMFRGENIDNIIDKQRTELTKLGFTAEEVEKKLEPLIAAGNKVKESFSKIDDPNNKDGIYKFSDDMEFFNEQERAIGRIIDLEKNKQEQEKANANNTKKQMADTVQQYERIMQLTKELISLSDGKHNQNLATTFEELQRATSDYNKSRIKAIDDGLDVSALNQKLDEIDEKFRKPLVDATTSVTEGYGKQIDGFVEKLQKAGVYTEDVEEKVQALKIELASLGKGSEDGLQGMLQGLNDFGGSLDGKLNNIIDYVNNQSSKHFSQLENIGDLGKQLDKMLGMDNLVNKTSRFQSVIASLKNSLNELLQSRSEKNGILSKEELDEEKKKLDAIQESINNLNKSKAYVKTTKQGTMMAEGQIFEPKDMEAALNQMAKMETAHGRIKNGVTQTKDAIDDEGNAVKQVSKTYTYADGTVKKFTATMQKGVNGMRTMSSETKGAIGLAGTFKQIVSGLGKHMLFYFSGYRMMSTLFSELRNGLTVLKDYDNSLTTIKYTMRGSEKDFERLGQSAIDLANDLNTSLTDAMSVAQIYANLNETVNSIKDKSSGTLILSNLAGMDADTAATDIQAVVQAFNKTDDEINHIVDVYDMISSNIAVDYSI